MKKRVLIIDDNDLSDEIINLERLTRQTVEFYQFNIGSTFLTEVLTQNRIDLDKVESVFIEKFGKKRLNIVCFDYELGFEDITGVHILAKLKPRLSRARFIFYSSVLDNIVTRILRRQQVGSMSFDEARILMMSLINSRAEEFVDRKNFADAIMRALSQDEETLDDIFTEKMRTDYPNFCTDYFDGLELNNLNQLLNNRDGRALKFKREIVEHLIAYLIRLQDEK